MKTYIIKQKYIYRRHFEVAANNVDEAIAAVVNETVKPESVEADEPAEEVIYGIISIKVEGENQEIPFDVDKIEEILQQKKS